MPSHESSRPAWAVGSAEIPEEANSLTETVVDDDCSHRGLLQTDWEGDYHL